MTSDQTFDGAAAARAVAELLRAEAGEAERQGRLSTTAVAALADNGLLKLWRPPGVGGHAVRPLEYALCAEAVARADSAAAWLMMAVANTSFDLRLADERFVEEVFSRDDVVLCESFNRPFSARQADGGYRVTGSTPFVSGCRNAHWIGHTAVVDERFLLVFHPADALVIEDDWYASGMRGTSSNTVRAEDVFVPAHRVIDFTAGGGNNRYYDAPLYRLPEGILTTTFAPVSLGLLSAALDELQELAERKQPFASQTTLKHRTLAQMHFGRALAAYRAARGFYHQTLEVAFARVCRAEPFSLTDKADLFLACAHVLQTCAQATRWVAQAAGTSAVYEGSRIERALRDTGVIAQHAFGAEGRFATVAQAYWGVEVDFPLLAMD